MAPDFQYSAVERGVGGGAGAVWNTDCNQAFSCHSESSSPRQATSGKVGGKVWEGEGRRREQAERGQHEYF